MKKRVFTVVSVVAGLLFAGVLFADNDMLLQNSNTKIDGVIEAVQSAKIQNVKSIEFDDGAWEVKTQVKQQGTKYQFNEQSKALVKVKTETENDLQPPAELDSLMNAVKVGQDKGYLVSNVDFEGNSWEVEGFSKDKNLEYTILVDVKDGKMVPNSEQVDD